MIDVHVHIFPDGVAERAVGKLADAAGIQYFSDGTAQALCDSMRGAGVTTAVNLPVATKPEQVRGINRWIVGLSRAHPALTSFGAMHPRCENPREEIAFLSEQGVKGIKLHPEYQDFYPDDDRCAQLYEACRDYGVVVSFHAGVDLGFSCCHGTPGRFVPVLSIAGLNIILAHMGGYRMWDAVERDLVGTRALFDTSFSYELGADRMRRLITAHGPDKILFGTDSPWDNATRMKAFITSLSLDPKTEQKIFTGNAEALLGMSAAGSGPHTNQSHH